MLTLLLFFFFYRIIFFCRSFFISRLILALWSPRVSINFTTVVLRIPHNLSNFIIPTMFAVNSPLKLKIHGAFRLKIDLYYPFEHKSISFQEKYLYTVSRSVQTLLHLSWHIFEKNILVEATRDWNHRSTLEKRLEISIEI